MSEKPLREPGRVKRFLRRPLGLSALFFGFLILLMLVVWVQRVDIAEGLVKRALDDAGVAATYEIEDIGFRTQKLRNLVIGDPVRPDLVADEIDVSFDLLGSGTDIVGIRARGVRIWGRIESGKLRLGELDKLRDMESDAPFELPSFRADLDDVRMRIDTPVGAVGLALSGRGRLNDGFEGTAAAIGRDLAIGGCDMGEAGYVGDVAIRSRRAALDGKLMVDALGCEDAGVRLAAIDGNIALELAEDLTGGETRFALSGRRLDADQLDDLPALLADTPLAPLGRKLASALNTAARDFKVEGDMALTEGAEGRRLSVGSLSVEARSAARMELRGGSTVSFGADGWALDDGTRLALSGGGLPAMSLTLAGNSTDGFSGDFGMEEYRAGNAMLAIPDMRFEPRGNGRTRISGSVRLSGPVGGGQLSNLRFPLVATLEADGDFSAQPECFDVAIDGWSGSPFALSANRVRLCPPGGQYMVRNTPSGLAIAAGAGKQSLTGSYQSGPAALAWQAFSIAKTPTGSIQAQGRGLGLQLGRRADGQTIGIASAQFSDGRFALADATYLSRAPGGDTKASLARLSGRLGADGPVGELSGFSGEIRNVPLDIDDTSGRFRMANGMLVLIGQARVSYDRASLGEGEEPVFRPVRISPMRLRLAGGNVLIDGPMLLEETGREVAGIDLRHNLSSGVGDARLIVDRVAFDDGQQPYQLFPAAFGVVSNVQGSASGQGTIRWTAKGVSSDGVFSIADTSLVAAFGTVSGLSGTVRFTDLLGLETAPGQMLSLATVNPGIEVQSGQVYFQLLPGMRVRIEKGEWPFAGGQLVMRPTILDFSSAEPRYLSFYIDGLDAAKFVNEMGYENISASGIFDGELPMVFDEDGGRLDNGRLLSREGGGTLAYLGELSYEDMGVFANFAFDALKSIRYNRLEIDMNGDIAGEIITEIQFSGLQQGDGAARNFITRQLAKLPLEFNINIRAPFMELLGTVRGFSEPELLVMRNYDALLQEQRRREAQENGVQPTESDDMP